MGKRKSWCYPVPGCVSDAEGNITEYDSIKRIRRYRTISTFWLQPRSTGAKVCDTDLVVCKGNIKVKVKWSHYRPGVAWRVGRGIALLFHDRGTRRWWVVSSAPRPHFTPGKDPVPFLQEAGWTPGPVWTGEKSRPNRDSIPDRPACSQSLYRLSYRAHKRLIYYVIIIRKIWLC